jgi:hypothetical protein
VIALVKMDGRPIYICICTDVRRYTDNVGEGVRRTKMKETYTHVE